MKYINSFSVHTANDSQMEKDGQKNLESKQKPLNENQTKWNQRKSSDFK